MKGNQNVFIPAFLTERNENSYSKDDLVQEIAM